MSIFWEKDINCYLYAMKFKDKDSQNILKNFMHNIYSYAMTGKKVGCRLFNGTMLGNYQF